VEGNPVAIISYAQNHEDVLLNRLFRECPSGFYIDVGACHPLVHSVTKLFYERGWHGINIEPMPSLCEMLAHDRQRDINLRVGLSNRTGTATFYECVTSFELSTFSEERAEDLRRRGHDLVEHCIAIATLARVCEQYARRTIDFLKIDVESYEREVLEGADWSRYRPRVVVVEATQPETNIPSHDHWEPLLFAADYLFAFFDGLNRYYVRAEDRQLLPLLGVPVNVFDQYELYEHRREVQQLRNAFAANQESLGRTQGDLSAAQSQLDEAQTALMETRRALSDSQTALHGIGTRFDAAQAKLEATQARLEVTQAQLEATRDQHEATQARLETTQAQLEVTQTQREAAETRLEGAEAQLDMTRAQLAPFQELGPIAISVARRLRRMSRRSPRLASLAKRVIRRAYARARELVPSA
jgi:FkbM family methyltransferase